MIIALDQTIPFGERAFSGLGELRFFVGRNLRPADARDADAIVVRSTTRIDADVLDGSSVQFVGTATIGTDHIDEEYLRRRGIRLAAAAGSNANSVAEYVVAALLAAAERRGWCLSEKSIAIVGAGNIGARVEQKARALGMEVALCDPPLKDQTGDDRYRSLDEVLAADFITFHVPLTTRGLYPTRHMVDSRLLGRLAPHQVLLNASRGPVFDGDALRAALQGNRLGGAIMDVWEHEPRIDYSLLQLLEIGTAHIAGFSLDGKLRATGMIRNELCNAFHLDAPWDECELYPAARTLGPDTWRDTQAIIASIVRKAYDILRDDERLRELQSLESERAARAFDRLRNEYPLRPEFRHYRAALPEDSEAARPLRGLGFSVIDNSSSV